MISKEVCAAFAGKYLAVKIDHSRGKVTRLSPFDTYGEAVDCLNTAYRAGQRPHTLDLFKVSVEGTGSMPMSFVLRGTDEC